MVCKKELNNEDSDLLNKMDNSHESINSRDQRHRRRTEQNQNLLTLLGLR